MAIEETLNVGMADFWRKEESDWVDWYNAVEQLELEVFGITSAGMEVA